MDALSVRALVARAPTLNAEHLQALVAAAGGDLTQVLGSSALADVELPPKARSYLTFPDETRLRADLEWIAASEAQLLASTDPGYPPQLLQTPGSPAVLFVLGKIPALSTPQLAMVGSRSATPGGCKTARDFAACFSRAGLTITSGLAMGIDAASHEGALLAGGATIAVCGTGLDRVYPTQHERLAARIRSSGALVSEFPPGTAPLPANFPRRNRLISGLSLGVLVVEATHRSGSLVTARHAGEQGRDVFAVPGSIHSPQSSGCHKLIRQGALLVEDPADVLLELKIPLLNESLTRRPAMREHSRVLDKGYEMLLDAVGFEPATVDILVARTGISGETIVSMLLVLELEGRIAPYPGGRFGRIPE
jgi:DNA processing protein